MAEGKAQDYLNTIQELINANKDLTNQNDCLIKQNEDLFLYGSDDGMDLINKNINIMQSNQRSIEKNNILLQKLPEMGKPELPSHHGVQGMKNESGEEHHISSTEIWNRLTELHSMNVEMLNKYGLLNTLAKECMDKNYRMMEQLMSIIMLRENPAGANGTPTTNTMGPSWHSNTLYHPIWGPRGGPGNPRGPRQESYLFPRSHF